MKARSIRALLMLVTCCGLSCARTPANRTYANQRFGFCFEYPQDWQINEAFTQNGVALRPIRTDRGVGLGSLIVGARQNQPSIDESRLRTLNEDFDETVAALTNQEPSLKVLSKKQTKLAGMPAITSSLEFTERATGQRVRSESTTAIGDNGLIYFIELKTGVRDADDFQRALKTVTMSFRAKCGGWPLR